MPNLMAKIYIPVATLLAGGFAAGASMAGQMDAASLSAAALAGVLMALHVSWFIAGKFETNTRPVHISHRANKMR